MIPKLSKIPLRRDRLVDLDVSFCREVTDGALGALVDACPNLRRLHLWGCTQVNLLS